MPRPVYLFALPVACNVPLIVFCSPGPCHCPDAAALGHSLLAAEARIAELEVVASRIPELEAAVARLTLLESRVSLLLAADPPLSDESRL